jgi:hypothetical protein
MNALTASIVTVIAALVLLLPRRWALLAMVFGLLYLTQYQVLELLSLHLTPLRLLELAGVARVTMRHEFELFKLNSIDRAVLAVYGYTTAVFLVRSETRHLELTGWFVDSTFCYFIFRALLKHVGDLAWLLRMLPLLLAPYAAMLARETLTQSNPFAVMGADTNPIRGDRIRCTGSFGHPILLGTFGAAFLPLYIGLTLVRDSRAIGVIGIALCLAIVWFSNSGGPLTAALGAMLGWMCWAARGRMGVVKAGLVGLLALLVLTMQAPVWYLPARISSLTGGGGYHRSYLMDVAFRDLDRWWLAGMDVSQTAGWFPYPLITTRAADITNAFIDFGIKGGLPAMLLFLLLLVFAFRYVGRGFKVLQRASGETYPARYLVWGLGCALVVHISSWLGVTYFDQMYAVWFMQLAAIAAIPQRTVARARSDVAIGGRRIAGRPLQVPTHPQ